MCQSRSTFDSAKNSGAMPPDRFVFSYSYIIILISTNSNTFQPLYFLLYCERKTFFFRSPDISLRAQADATPNNRKRLFTSKCACICFYILCTHAQRVHLEKSIIFFSKNIQKKKSARPTRKLFFLSILRQKYSIMQIIIYFSRKIMI